ncbi:TMV resistance protein N-like [Senna tora]|uniref:TMV resistance protein N-like n=1 Tax=Senna tora TaxID=362788 RepID=A0A834WY46_9FABA|nr:TMV resistance protein N-like [Senna tora]
MEGGGGLSKGRGNPSVDLEWCKEEGEDASKRMLFGKIVTEKPLNKASVKNILQKVWNAQGGLAIAEVGVNAFDFTFAKEEECRRIVREGPWTVMGFLLNIQPWRPMKSVEEEVEASFCEFWVQFHGLPVEGMSIKNIAKLGEKVWIVLEIEDPWVKGAIVRSFVRARIRIDIRKPLMGGMWVPRPNLQRLWISAKFEKLQNFCYGCGIFGHDVKSCEEDDDVSERYGLWLGTAPIRAMGRIVKLVDGEPVEIHPQPEAEARGSSARGGDVGLFGPRRDQRNPRNSVRMDGKSPVEVTAGTPDSKGIKNVSLRVDNDWDGSFRKGKSPLGQEKNRVEPLKSVKKGTDKEGKWARSSVGVSIMAQSDMEIEMLIKSSPKQVSGRSPIKGHEGCKRELNYTVEIPSDDDINQDRLAIVVSKPRAHYVDKLAEDLDRVSIKRKAGEEVGSVMGKKLKQNIEGDDVLVKNLSISKEGVFTKPQCSSGAKGKLRKGRKSKGSKEGKGVKSIGEEGLIDVPVFVMMTSFDKKDDGSMEIIVEGYVKHLKEIIKRERPSLVFLMETRCNRRKVEKIQKKVVLGIVVSSMLMLSSEEIGFITLVYGPPKAQDKSKVWDKIGSKFTWNNKQLNDDHVKERIDRAMCNVAFREKFQNAQVVHLDTIGSDHCPLVVHFDLMDSKTPWSFKFEQMWLAHPDFHLVVREAWEVVTCDNASDMSHFVAKLDKSVGERDCSEALNYVGRMITDDDNELLMSPITLDEVKRAVFELGDLKAPGPDSFSGLFYQKAWDLVKEDLLKMSLGDMWVRMLKGLYFPNGSFMEAKRGSRPSWAWSSILEGRDLLEKALCWRIGGRWDVGKLRSVVSEAEVQAILRIPLSNGALPTKVALAKTKCAKDRICPLCNNGEESAEHLFFYRDITRLVWFVDPTAYRSDQCTSIDPLGIAKSATKLVDDYWSAKVLSSGVSNDHTCLRSEAALSWARRSQEALKLGLDLALDLDLNRIHLELDCANLVNIVNGVSSKLDWRCLSVAEEIVALRSNFLECVISWIPRQANRVADWVAFAASRQMCPLDWISNPPYALVNLLLADSLPPKEGVG